MASPLKYPHQVQSRLSDDAHAWLLVNRRSGETEAEQLRRLVEERRTRRRGPKGPPEPVEPPLGPKPLSPLKGEAVA